MKYDLKELLRDADLRGYAVPAFNFSDNWELKAILEAAQELRAPVIAASNMPVVQAHTPAVLGAMCKAITQASPTPVIFHLDHSDDPALCAALMDAGYPSVMIDGSLRPLAENISACKAVVAYARNKGVCVEGEIGRIGGRGDETTGKSIVGTLEDAILLAESTGVHSLAVGLGNAHGFYKGKPELDFFRLHEINDALSIPLVLHGGTGIPEEDIQRAIREGINKVNVGTELHHTYLAAMREYLAEDVAPNVLFAAEKVVEAVKQPIKRWIRLCMADGKA